MRAQVMATAVARSVELWAGGVLKRKVVCWFPFGFPNKGDLRKRRRTGMSENETTRIWTQGFPLESIFDPQAPSFFFSVASIFALAR